MLIKDWPNYKVLLTEKQILKIQEVCSADFINYNKPSGDLLERVGDELNEKDDELVSKYYKYAKKPTSPIHELLFDESFLISYKLAEKEWIEYWETHNCNLSQEYRIEERKKAILIGDFVTRLRRYLFSHPKQKELYFLLNTNNWQDAADIPHYSPRYNPCGDLIKMLDRLQSLIGDKVNKHLDIQGEINEVRESIGRMTDLNSVISSIDNKLIPLKDAIDKEEAELGQQV